MPIFWFSLSTSGRTAPLTTSFVFLILHLLVYPASNGYNSFCDKDEGSIGGLKRPPKVSPHLLYLVILFDILAVGSSFMIGWLFGTMVTIYLFISKAYSYPGIRLKKRPYTGTVVVTMFQGAFTYWTVKAGLGLPLEKLFESSELLFGLTSTFFLLGNYPLTQVYQHEEDKERGDRTLSYMLGIRGTFLFSALAFAIGTGLLIAGYFIISEPWRSLPFLILGTPILIYFVQWMKKTLRDPNNANFKYTMRMNLVASLSLSAAFFVTWLIAVIG